MDKIDRYIIEPCYPKPNQRMWRAYGCQVTKYDMPVTRLDGVKNCVETREMLTGCRALGEFGSFEKAEDFIRRDSEYRYSMQKHHYNSRGELIRTDPCKKLS